LCFIAEAEKNLICQNTYHVILSEEGNAEIWDYMGKKKIETFYLIGGKSQGM
jgi:hypothetical protein